MRTSSHRLSTLATVFVLIATLMLGAACETKQEEEPIAGFQPDAALVLDCEAKTVRFFHLATGSAKRASSLEEIHLKGVITLGQVTINTKPKSCFVQLERTERNTPEIRELEGESNGPWKLIVFQDGYPFFTTGENQTIGYALVRTPDPGPGAKLPADKQGRVTRLPTGLR